MYAKPSPKTANIHCRDMGNVQSHRTNIKASNSPVCRMSNQFRRQNPFGRGVSLVSPGSISGAFQSHSCARVTPKGQRARRSWRARVGRAHWGTPMPASMPPQDSSYSWMASRCAHAIAESTFRSRSRATYVSTRVESHDAPPQRTRRRNSGSLRLLLSADTVAPHG
jgi:hypothetical protein